MLASALAVHKTAAKMVVAAQGVTVLPSCDIDRDRPAELMAKELTEALPLPIIIKPVSEDGSIDMRLSLTEDDVATAVDELRSTGQALFAELFRSGRSVTAGVLDDGEHLRVPPPLETRPKGDFYDYPTKNDPNAFTNNCPADLPAKTEELVNQHAQTA